MDMNKLPIAKRAKILNLLCEGSSMRAISRVEDVSINTVTKLLVDAGEACIEAHDRLVRGVKSKRVQIDEIWAFCGAKQKNVSTMKAPISGAGDIWTWTAIDADTKLMISYAVGGRDAEYAAGLVEDLASRLANRVQLTTDGHKPYLQAIEGAFGCDVDYAMLIKLYGAAPEGQRRYSPAECTGIKIEKITGNPDGAHISTSYVERSNLNIRMHNRRHTRLTNAFSKKAQNHLYAQALYFMFYNFVRIHKTLRMAPAMAAGVSTKLWEMSDIVALIDAQAEAAKPVRISGDTLVG